MRSTPSRGCGQSGCRLALLTNGSAADAAEQDHRFGLADLFDLILIEGEARVRQTGSTSVYDARARFTRVSRPPMTWMVGDNLEWDVARAAAAGHLWHLDRRPRPRPASRVIRCSRIESFGGSPSCASITEGLIMTEPSSLLVRHVRELARHMAWADATVWSAVLTAPAGRERRQDCRHAASHSSGAAHLSPGLDAERRSRCASAVSLRHSTTSLLGVWKGAVVCSRSSKG